MIALFWSLKKRWVNMNKTQTLEILKQSQKRIMNMTEKEKEQLSKKIDDFCDENDRNVKTYARSKFSLIDPCEISLPDKTYEAKRQAYRQPDSHTNKVEIRLNRLITEAA